MRGAGDGDVGDTSCGFDRRGDFYFANSLSSRAGADVSPAVIRHLREGELRRQGDLPTSKAAVEYRLVKHTSGLLALPHGLLVGTIA